MARDYKRSRGGQEPFSGWAGFALGLFLGLGVGLAFWFLNPREAPPAAEGPAAAGGPASGREGAEPEPEWDYPDMLKNHEVAVPEREAPLRGGSPTAPIERPGSYAIQAGSYRQFADADRVRAQLALQGIESQVQRVSIDADTWHRVRIGPVSDLAELNRIRARLREAEIDFYVFAVRE